MCTCLAAANMIHDGLVSVLERCQYCDLVYNVSAAYDHEDAVS